MRNVLAVLLLGGAALILGQARPAGLRTWKAQWETPVATHKWITTTGDLYAAASWSSGTAPVDQATETLTITGAITDGETVVIDSKTYTFKDSLTDTDGFVLNEPADDREGTLDNLVAAITLGAGAGTKYAASTTLHSTITAADGAGTTVDMTAKRGGTGGNSLTTTEGMANGAFGAGTMSGGAVNWGTSDLVVFDDTSVVNADTNLDLREVDVDRWHVTEGYTGNIGSDASSMLDVAAVIFNYKGVGSLYLTCNHGSSSIGQLIVDSANLLSAATVDNKITRGDILAGKVLQIGSTTTTIWTVAGVSAYLVLNSSSGRSSDLALHLGRVDETSGTSSASLTLIAGGFYDTSSAGVGGSSGAYTGNYIQTGGRWRHVTLAEVSTNHTFRLLGGTFDGLGMTSDAFLGIYIYPGADPVFSSAVSTGPYASIIDMRQPYP